MVKVVCPVCGKMGILQVRGNSKRVQHYVGYKNGKRKYVYHPFRDNLLPEASSLRSSGVGLRGFKSAPRTKHGCCCLPKGAPPISWASFS